MKRRIAPVLATLVALAVAGCSLSGLARVDLPVCSSDTACQVLNDSQGIGASACARWQCEEVTGRCVRRDARDDDEDGDAPVACGGTDCDDTTPRRRGNGAAEVCDGIDNDCDRVIDEDVLAGNAFVTAVPGITDLRRGAVATTPGGVLFSAATAPGTSLVATLPSPGEQARAGVQMAFRQQASVARSWFNIPELTDGCPGPNTCNVSQIALAPASGSDVFAVAVSTGGCAAGSVRIGYAGSDLVSIVMRGPAARTRLAEGFDLDASGCNGAARAAGAPHGATSPAVAGTLDALGRATGVAAWLADAETRAACGGSEVGVEALGLWLERGSAAGQPVAWVSGSGNAVPLSVGTTRDGAPPAVLSLEEAGFAIVWADARGEVNVRRVAPLAPAPTLGTDGDGTAPRAMPELTLEPPHTIGHGAANASSVVAAVAGVHGETWRVGTAWVEGCGTESAVLWFARATWSPTAGWQHDAPARLSGNGAVRGSPSVLALSSGFVEPGYAHGSSTSTAEDTGGWLVAWAEADGMRTTVRVRRTLAMDGSALDSAPAAVGSLPSAAGAWAAPLARTYPGLARVLAHDGGGGIVAGSVCGAGSTTH